MPDRESSSTPDRLATPLRRWLAHSPWALTLWATAAAFTTYFCMYAFRKPFTAASYPGAHWGMDYKGLLVTAQLLGYMLSKFAGIKVVSEASPARRAGLIFAFIATAESALILFPLLPAPWNGAALFLNGLPLGMIWGLVYGFLEGRKVSEFLGLGLSVSFIFASGWTKSAGVWAMNHWQVSPFWMPAVTGLLFTPALLVALWMLTQIPPPNAEDIALRSQRLPMNRSDRLVFLAKYGWGIAALTLAYVLLSTYRAVRDDFMIDILKEMGRTVPASLFASVETKVGLCILAALSALWFIQNNQRALWANLIVVCAGALLLGLSSALFLAGHLAPETFLTLTGIGVYLGYVPYNSILFDRLLASLRAVGTATFLISLADSYGYLATAGVYLFRTVLRPNIPWGRLLLEGGIWIAVLVPLLVAGAGLYFQRLRNRTPHPHS